MRPSKLARPLLTSLFLLTAACTSPTTLNPNAAEFLNGDAVEGVTLSIARSSYTTGDEAVIHLVNDSSGEIGYNACMAAFEFWNGEEWIRIESLRLCTAALDPLAAGERTSFAESISSYLQPGGYRIALRVHRPDRADQLDLRTVRFEVGR